MKKNIKRVDLYIKSKSAENTVPWHTQKCWSAGSNMLTNHPIIESSEYELCVEETKVKMIFENIEKRYGINLYIHDLAYKGERRGAIFKRIKSTPTMIADREKITDIAILKDEDAILKTLGINRNELYQY
jgi:hypothetical protein